MSEETRYAMPTEPRNIPASDLVALTDGSLVAPILPFTTLLSAQQELQHQGSEMRAALGDALEPSKSRRMEIMPRRGGSSSFLTKTSRGRSVRRPSLG